MIETVEFSAGIKEAVEATKSNETLIIATADHSHVFTIGGYSTLDNDILGNKINRGIFCQVKQLMIQWVYRRYKHGRCFKAATYIPSLFGFLIQVKPMV